MARHTTPREMAMRVSALPKPLVRVHLGDPFLGPKEEMEEEEEAHEKEDEDTKVEEEVKAMATGYTQESKAP